MKACSGCGVPLADRGEDLCVKCRRRAATAERSGRASSKRRRVDLEPAHSRPWVNRRGG